MVNALELYELWHIRSKKSSKVLAKECNESGKGMRIGNVNVMNVTIMHMIPDAQHDSLALASEMPNIVGIVQCSAWLSHHIYNFIAHKMRWSRFTLCFCIFLVQPTDCVCFFFHNAILWNRKLYFIINVFVCVCVRIWVRVCMCVLYFISVFRWLLAASVHWTYCSLYPLACFFHTTFSRYLWLFHTFTLFGIW